VAFLIAHPTPWNAGVFIVADIALVLRALMEERILSADTGISNAVGSGHLVLGVF
jgi:hypothetical protein